MQEIIIPNPNRKRALLIIDIQPGFVDDRNAWIVPNVVEVLKRGKYDLVVEAVFHAEPGSLWDRQMDWTFPLTPTISEIKDILPIDVITVTKTTKSIFKGDKDIVAILKEKNIEEVHLVGLDTNDCVFASAQEAFDLGFFTYVIEEGTESSQNAQFRTSVLDILRELGMTNHSER